MSNIEQRKAEHAALLDQAEAVVVTAIEEGRELTEAETNQVTETFAQSEVVAADIKQENTNMENRTEAAEARVEEVARPEIVVTRAELPYKPQGGPSYFRDMIDAKNGDVEARERLTINERAAETRDGSTGSGSFGSFIAPVYLIDQAAELARSGRPFADALPKGGAPTGTTISIPRITTGSSVAAQNGDNGNVAEQDLAATSYDISVKTIAGQVDTSVQSLELANGAAVDRIIFADLAAAAALELDRQLLNGAGANGELIGLRGIAGLNEVTYTDGTPTAGEFYSRLAAAVAKCHADRKVSPSAIVMHPRRWAFLLGSTDNSNRPLITPVAPQNGLGTFANVAEGVAGSLLGLPVLLDANVLTDRGAGGNEDEVFIIRAQDHVLFEGPLRTRVLSEIGSGNLTVRFQTYQHAAYAGGRYPAGIVRVHGTGLVNPF